MINKIIKSSPYIYLLLAVLILPLKVLGATYLHYIFLFLIIILLFPQSGNAIRKRHNIYVWIFIFFVVWFTTLTFLVSQIKFTTILESSLIYFLSPLFWILYFTKYSDYDFLSFLKFSIYIAFALSIFGFIQFYFSKTIFGLIPNNEYFDIDFTSSQFVSSGSTFRIRSILPSSQIFALFTSLSFCLSTIVFKNNKTRFYLISIPILFASLLSGQRIVILVIILFFVSKFVLQSKNNLRSIFLIILPIFLILLALRIIDLISTDMGMASTRLMDIFNNFSYIIDYEQNARWSKWISLIKETNPLIGNGIGHTNQFINGTRIVTSESYIIQLYYEGGILLVGSFILLLFNSIQKTLIKKLSSTYLPIIISLFISLLSVHSFMNPIFIVYWGILIYPLSINRSKNF